VIESGKQTKLACIYEEKISNLGRASGDLGWDFTVDLLIVQANSGNELWKRLLQSQTESFPIHS
jgi:hypothetical protein